jgi:hypothetical protein
VTKIRLTLILATAMFAFPNLRFVAQEGSRNDTANSGSTAQDCCFGQSADSFSVSCSKGSNGSMERAGGEARF